LPALIGAPFTSTSCVGWGVTLPRFGGSGSRVIGYGVHVTTTGLTLGDVSLELRGGNITNPSSAQLVVCNAGAYPSLIGGIGGASGVTMEALIGSPAVGAIDVAGGNLVLGGVNIAVQNGPAIASRIGGRCQIGGGGTGTLGQANTGLSVRALMCGLITIQTNPNFGRALPDLDWSNGNGADQNKSFFGAAGVHTPISTDGSVIVRQA
jgi:hypothetical protein